MQTVQYCHTTTDDYHLWAHGFAVTATLFHSVRLLEALVARPGLTLAQLCGATRANAGHAAVLLRTLTTLGWVSRGADGTYRTTRGVALCAASGTVARLCADVYGEAGESARKDVAWGSRRGWRASRRDGSCRRRAARWRTWARCSRAR